MMPPNPGVHVGGDTIVDSWFQGGLGSEDFGELKLVLTRANRQPALRQLPPQAGRRPVHGLRARRAADRERERSGTSSASKPRTLQLSACPKSCKGLGRIWTNEVMCPRTASSRTVRLPDGPGRAGAVRPGSAPDLRPPSRSRRRCAQEIAEDLRAAGVEVLGLDPLLLRKAPPPPLVEAPPKPPALKTPFYVTGGVAARRSRWCSPLAPRGGTAAPAAGVRAGADAENPRARDGHPGPRQAHARAGPRTSAASEIARTKQPEAELPCDTDIRSTCESGEGARGRARRGG